MVLMALLSVVLPGFGVFFLLKRFFFLFFSSLLVFYLKVITVIFLSLLFIIVCTVYRCTVYKNASAMHTYMHVCIVLAFLQFTLPSCLPLCFSLSFLCISDWAPLSILSLSEEISSYKVIAISLQESKMNYCCSIIFFSWRPDGEMRQGSCSSFGGPAP